MNTPKNKKNAPAGLSESKAKAQEEKLIRPDDLIPKENVLGGRQLLFGDNTNNPLTRKKNGNDYKAR